jgi:hypothetical protein
MRLKFHLPIPYFATELQIIYVAANAPNIYDPPLEIMEIIFTLYPRFIGFSLIKIIVMYVGPECPLLRAGSGERREIERNT